MMAAAVAQKLVTASMNALMIRYVTAEIMGFAGNDMELLLSSILFLSRESFRHVADRFPAGAALTPVPPNGRQLDGNAAVLRARIVGTSLLPVPLGLALSLLAACIYAAYFASKATNGSEAASFFCFCGAAALETLAEPLYILSASSLLHAVRARAEVAATLVKCVISFALALAGWGALSFGIAQVAFSLTLLACYWQGLSAHIASTRAAWLVDNAAQTALAGKPAAAAGPPTSVAALLSEARWPEARAALARGAPRAALSELVGPEGARLLGGFAGQGVVKHLLTEGDRMLLALLASRADRGAHAVVANYGSLAARLVFCPLEESLRRLTAQSGLAAWLAKPTAATAAATGPASATVAAVSSEAKLPAADAVNQPNKGSAKQRRGNELVGVDGPSKTVGAASREVATIPSFEPAVDVAAHQQALGAFSAASYLVSWIGMAAVAFGPALAPLFVRYVLGRAWMSQPSDASGNSTNTAISSTHGSSGGQSADVAGVLSAYCVYLLCMAVNGVTEGFATALADASRLHAANIALAGAFAAYAAAAAVLLPRFGTPGLVLAGCVNMAVRISSSVAFISSSLRARGVPFSLRDGLPSLRVLAVAAAGALLSLASAGVFAFPALPPSAQSVAGAFAAAATPLAAVAGAARALLVPAVLGQRLAALGSRGGSGGGALGHALHFACVACAGLAMIAATWLSDRAKLHRAVAMLRARRGAVSSSAIERVSSSDTSVATERLKTE